MIAILSRFCTGASFVGGFHQTSDILYIFCSNYELPLTATQELPARFGSFATHIEIVYKALWDLPVHNADLAEALVKLRKSCEASVYLGLWLCVRSCIDLDGYLESSATPFYRVQYVVVLSRDNIAAYSS